MVTDSKEEETRMQEIGQQIGKVIGQQTGQQIGKVRRSESGVSAKNT